MNDEQLERLGMLADILQIANFTLNVKEVSNDEIMKMLERQNKEYLDEILTRLDKFEEKIMKKD